MHAVSKTSSSQYSKHAQTFYLNIHVEGNLPQDLDYKLKLGLVFHTEAHVFCKWYNNYSVHKEKIKVGIDINPW